MTTIMPAFEKFPEEGAIIGRLLAGYGELELSLCQCVAIARGDFNMVFKAMFRPRGESQRIQVADAMGREPYRSERLGTLFEDAVGAMRYCLKIRNQFAHCYWTDDFGRSLGFVELETTARSNGLVNDVYHIPAADLDLATLQAQEEFFVYVRHCLRYLNHEMRSRLGKSSSHPFPAPQRVGRPPLCKP